MEDLIYKLLFLFKQCLLNHSSFPHKFIHYSNIPIKSSFIFVHYQVITAGGYREPITLAQIKTNLEMESHEEKLHMMIKTSKMDAAKDQARDAAKAIRERQKEGTKLSFYYEY